VTLEPKLDRMVIEILRRGILYRELDLLVVGPLGQLLLVLADYAGRRAAATVTLTTGNLDLESVDPNDPVRDQLARYKGEVCVMYEGQIATWLADPAQLWRAVAMLSGVDQCFSIAPPERSISASAASTESPAESSGDRPRGRPPDEAWTLIENEVFDWLDHEGEPLPGEQVNLEDQIDFLLRKHKKDMSERAIRDHVPIYLANYRRDKTKRSTDK
jgi:hypothetical protein